MKKPTLLLILISLFISDSTFGQISIKEFESLEYRNIGPTRGGRCTAVAGHQSDLFTFYMGATGGGVWKTNDAGTTWSNISDDYFKVGSVGSIAVAPSDPNVIYVGTGSAEPRGNVSLGNGMYKSTDRGESWSHIGLNKGGQIGKLAIHPSIPDIVYAAVLGNIFTPNPERGVYRTMDGGKTWKNVLFVSDRTGAIDIAMDPTNHRILYAGMWTAERKPWTFIDGSDEGGVWKSIDSGDTWKKVENGLPLGVVGKVGLAISPANPKRVWVQIEHEDEEKGGLYRSDDGGKKFEKICRDHNIRQRAWYYSRIIADPKNENVLYNTNVGFWKSIDGGKTFSRIRTPHGDNHALWINPDRPEVMVEGNDGGACVTLNGGDTWSSINNQPTAEFYRVTVDNQFPYRVYGAQQDNSTISIPSRTEDALTPFQDWFPVGGGESGHIAIDPRDPNVIYAGTYIGVITYRNRSQGYQRDVVAYPQMHDGQAGRDIKYRFQWNAPIRISPHNPDVVYHCSQFVHRTKDQGVTWETISPDLTTNNDAYQDIPGGPVQHDHTGVELYTTIFAFEESPQQAGVLWAGSDDGLIHISMDNGSNWKNITPPKMPKDGTVNNIDLSNHKNGKAFVSVFKYRDGDFKPYIFRTEDFGKNWKLLTDGQNGIPSDHFVRVVREDPVREGLLYAGTEYGMYISFDEGKKWQSFQQNLPATPITDMLIKEDDIVLATQGRSFWIMDNISPLRTISDSNKLILITDGGGMRTQLRNHRGQVTPDPAPAGALIYYYLPEKPDSTKDFRITIADPEGKVRRVFSTKPDKDQNEEKIDPKKGLNKMVWNLRYEQPETLDKAIFSLASTAGVMAFPGNHKMELKIGDQVISEQLIVSKDPRWPQSDSDLKLQHDVTMQVKTALNQIHGEIGNLRNVRKQIESIQAISKEMGVEINIKEDAKMLLVKIDEFEKQLIQTKNESGQDPINYPSMLDDQVAYLYSHVNQQDGKPTSGATERMQDLEREWAPISAQIKQFISSEVKAFNDSLILQGVKPIMTKVIRP